MILICMVFIFPGNGYRIDLENPLSRFVCNTCGSKYKYLSGMLAHLKIHTGETHCAMCNKSLSCRAAYRRHMSSVHGTSIEYKSYQKSVILPRTI